VDTDLGNSSSAAIDLASRTVSHALVWSETWPSPRQQPSSIPATRRRARHSPEWRTREVEAEHLRERIAALEAQNQELRAFADTVAHDLKSPLHIMAGYAEVMQSYSSTLSAAEAQDCLGRIRRQANKMNGMIDELLLLAGVRQQELEACPLDMGSIVAEATQRLAPTIQEYQAEIALPQVWPLSWGYGPWIEEVWANYLSNAIKYGGRPPLVQVGTTLLDGFVRFWVRDNGRGLTLDERDRLFTPFVRLDQDRVEGHGLGLSIVKHIVEKLRGEVGIESRLGQGSVFSFTLPAEKVFLAEY